MSGGGNVTPAKRLIMMGKTQPIATFTRSSIAYLSDGTQVAANKPRFEPGKFGKAIMVEEETTNLIGSVGSFETDSNGAGIADGWNAVLYGSIPSLVNDSLFGIKAQRITSTTSDTNAARRIEKNVSITGGKTYTFSAYAKTDGATPAYLRIDTNGNTPVSLASLKTTATTWTKLQVTFTAPADATSVYVRCYNDAPIGAVGWVQFDGAQLEAKPYATSFIDGTRAAETLTIPPAGVLNPQEGTVACWVYVNDVSKYKNRYSTIFMAVAGGAGKGIWLHHSNNSANWEYQIKDENNFSTRVIVADNEIANGWHLFTAKWKSTEAKLFVDGALKGTMENPYLPSAIQKIDIGCWGAGNQLSSLIDDLRISSRARSDEEILEAYQSGQPAVADGRTTYKADFDEKIC